MSLLVMFGIFIATVAYGARLEQHHGHAWADQVCGTASLLCTDPHWFAAAAVTLLMVYLYQLSRAAS